MRFEITYHRRLFLFILGKSAPVALSPQSWDHHFAQQRLNTFQQSAVCGTSTTISVYPQLFVQEI